MANRHAIKNGNWSDTTTWYGGVIPSPGDIVRPNGFLVTINQNIDVSEMRNDASTSPTVASGGGFTTDGSARSLNIDYLYLGAVSPVNGVLRLVGGPVTLTGVLGWDCWSTNRTVIELMSPYDVVVTTDILYGQSVTGRTFITSSTSAGSINHLTILADVVSSDKTLLALNGQGTLNFTLNGNVTGGLNSMLAAVNSGGLQFLGVINGDLVLSGVIVQNCLAGSMLHVNADTIEAHNGFPAIEAHPNLSLTVTAREIIQSGNYAPIKCSILRLNPSPTGLTFLVRDSDNSVVTVSTHPDGVPAGSDVRQGVEYGLSNELTGSLAVPDAASVGYGVPVDDATGTATIAYSTLVETIGQQLATMIGE